MTTTDALLDRARERAGPPRSGLARQVASAAVARALGAGLLPQWRARSHPSKRVASALGFRELGAQLSVRLGR